MTRVVQLSDTHLSAAEPVPERWDALAAWLRADPPDLVVHTGDIVRLSPDDATDRDHARRLMDELGCRYVVVPGNHDVGVPLDAADDVLDEAAAYLGLDEIERATDARVAAFVEHWGADRFVEDVPGWRLVGVNAYRLTHPEHEAWVAAAIADRPAGALVGVFVHQPAFDPTDDAWVLPPASAAAFERATADPAVALVTSGHRHTFSLRRDGDLTRVWAPSTHYEGTPDRPHPGTVAVDLEPGVLEYHLRPGTHRVRLRRPWSGHTGPWR